MITQSSALASYPTRCRRTIPRPTPSDHTVAAPVGSLACYVLTRAPGRLVAGRIPPTNAKRVRMRFSRFLLLMSIVAAPAVAAAQPAPTPVAPAVTVPAAPEGSDAAAIDAELDALFGAGGLTAEAAAARAVQVSPEVRRRAAEVAAANAAAAKVQLVNVPRIATTLQYTRLSEVDAPQLAPGFSFPVFLNSYSASAEIAVPLSDYVLRIPDLMAGARAGLEAARASQQSSMVAVASAAKVAYYEWVRANLQKVVAERSVKQVEATLGQIRALVDVQRASRADLLRVEALLASARLTTVQLAGVVELRAEALRLSIGAGPQEALVIGEDVRGELAPRTLGTIGELIAAAQARRVELRTLEAGITARERQRQAEKAGRLPRLAAFAQANYSNPNQRVIPSRDQFDLTWAAGLSLSWNVNDFLGSRVGVDGLDAEVSGLRADRDRLNDGIRLEVVQAVTALRTAQSSIETTAQGLAAAEESYRVRKQLLAFERATAVEVVDAESEVTRARIAALSARVDLRLALVQLARALGEDSL